MRPKCLSKLKQKRLVAREHLRCVGHILHQLHLDIMVPDVPLRAIQPDAEERRVDADREPYRWNRQDGSATWDRPQPNTCDSSRPRLIVSPDEGSPLFSAYQYLLSKDALVHLSRDEL